MRVVVTIARKSGLSDPEGVATSRALRDLGYSVGDVHFGRTITLDVDTDDAEQARLDVTEMCERLLANPVIEDYEVALAPDRNPA